MGIRSYIWGALKNGRVAYQYFSGSDYDVVGFIDSNPNIQGEKMFGCEIFSPDVLKNEENVKVIIASENYATEILELLYREYNIEGALCFRGTVNHRYYVDKNQSVDQDAIIIELYEGLGNQMFTYSLYEKFKSLGKTVCIDVCGAALDAENRSEIERVFPAVHIEHVNKALKERYLDQVASFYDLEKVIYSENKIDSIRNSKDRLSVLNVRKGILKGYWTNEFYFNDISERIRMCFKFRDIDNDQLNFWKKQIESSNSVSVHIRRGDYINSKNIKQYIQLTETNYYSNAIHYITKYEPNYHLYVFSDDIEWVRENYQFKNASYIRPSEFDNYENWFDLYLMSLCKHNIIANSTFSWWGAWLNNNPNKIVVAPSGWFHYFDDLEICPKEWVRLSLE